MKRSLAGALLAVLLLSGCSAIPKKPPTTPPEAPPATTPAQPTTQAPAAPTQPAQPTQPAPESPKPVTPDPAPPPKPPEPAKATIEPAPVAQGDVAVIRLDKAVEGSVRVRVDGLWEQPRTYIQNGKAAAFIGIPADAKVGSYPVTVTWSGGQWNGSLAVAYRQFTEDRLIVTEEQRETFYDPKQDAEWAKIFSLRSGAIAEPQWKGPFRAPIDGKLNISTHFGEIRFINDKEYGRHSGMDFEAAEGTPVLAPAPGKVVMTEKMIVSGMTVIIDHGMNLYTTYYHMSAYSVKPGDWVVPGQEIGKVGNTGFSLGAHLHWTASIGNIPVDPWPMTQKSPLGIVN